MAEEVAVRYVSRDQAMALELTSYNDGSPCSRGHLTPLGKPPPRWTANRGCKYCHPKYRGPRHLSEEKQAAARERELLLDKPPFRWSKDNRKRLIRSFVDSGDMATARDAVGCTPSELIEEQQKN